VLPRVAAKLLMRRALLALVAPLLMGAAPIVPLEMPDTLRLADYADGDEVGRGLGAALGAKKWQIESDTGTSVTARHEERGAMLRVRIEYTPERVSYRYVDSTGLGHARVDGEDYIHPAANKWLSRLAKQVRAQVLRYASEREATQVVPVEPEPDGGQ
jgi:hypothetical protein